ncbi:MAG: efflux RND transporter periplasmic adaptor subunit [Hyphomicrobiaceae bacterium]
MRGTSVTVAVAKSGNAARVVYATGVVEPVHWAKISALERKRIVELCKCEGEEVKAGEVVARLDDGEERARLLELEARLMRLHSDAERIKNLVERGATSQLTYEEKLTQVREFEARIEAQKDRIADLALKSPIDGVVLRRDGEVGEIAGTAANQTLLWIGQPKPLQVVAEVNEEDIGDVKPGQSVLLHHEGHVGQSLSATVNRVTPKGDPQTKTFRAYLSLPDETPLMIGMSVEANIIIQESNGVVLIPAESLLDDTVQIVRDGRARRQSIEAGVRGTRFVEIRTGLEAGDIVLAPFRQDLKEAARVHFDPRPTP